ncbi:MAG TPA: cob(I)yrinic acid a,c-diamide adenosyltransferase [Caulobacterales bacterium]|nr:cob(I)yrinic acid a,c-diamide adenosyltransferase [Caulobacterales bacterium]
MVKLDKIVTKAGDGGQTRLATGQQVSKADARVEAYGAIDETNSALGVARLHAKNTPLDALLERVQHDLFDLGADLATPLDAPFEIPRIVEAQVERLEREIDALQAAQTPLTSFVLPGGSPTAAHLHLARAIARRAERAIVRLMETETISPLALKYANRLSDLLFVAARTANDDGATDVLWKPGVNR